MVQAKRLLKYVLLSLISIAIILPMLSPAIIFADDKAAIVIETELGIGGKSKRTKWSPLKITLTSDRDISGDVVFRNTENYGRPSASYVQHVELPAGTAKEITMAIPAEYFSKDNNEIKFYEDSVHKGKTIPFSSGKSYIQSSPTSETATLVGALSNDPDTMNFLNVLRGSGFEINVVSLKAEQIPEQPILLDSLDVLVINNFASDTLSAAQAESISDWVSTGGQLVLAGGAGYQKSAAAFAELSPVIYKGTYSAAALPELANLGGKPLKLDGDFTLADSTPNPDTTVLYENESKPLFASREIEQGKVYYASYDLSMEPLASWNGHATAWSMLLHDQMALVNQPYGGNNFENLFNSINYVLDYFPSLHLPQFSTLVWLLIAYAIIVAPVLYLILKRLDKREWAWWMIPVIALLASGAIYMVGASDKTKEMAHTINIIELNGKGTGQIKSASAFFNPGSGDYTLDLPEESYVRLQSDFGVFGASDNLGLVEMTDQQTNVYFKDLPQWSLSKLWVEQRSNKQIGQVDIAIAMDDKGQLEGSVKNNTSHDLTDMNLLLGGKMYRIGDLAKEEEKEIDVSKPIQMMVGYGAIGHSIYPYPSNLSNGDPYARQRELLSTYTMHSSMYNSSSYLFAWSEDEMFNYSYKGEQVNSSQLNLWTQKVEMNWRNNNGVVQVPYGFITPVIAQVNSSDWFQDFNMIHISSGSIQFEYVLPEDLKGLAYEELSLRQNNLSGAASFEIWNNDTNAWESMTFASKEWKAPGNIEAYLMGGERLRLSMTVTGQTNMSTVDLALKGKVNP